MDSKVETELKPVSKKDAAGHQTEAERVARWQEENREAFKAHNDHLAKYGTTAERAKGLR